MCNIEKLLCISSVHKVIQMGVLQVVRVKEIETTKEKCLWTSDALKDWAKEDFGQWSSPGGSYP
jgi:hypothetical protein